MTPFIDMAVCLMVPHLDVMVCCVQGWRRRQQDELNGETLSASRWRSLRASLLQENAVWAGSKIPSQSNWQLDPTEVRRRVEDTAMAFHLYYTCL